MHFMLEKLVGGCNYVWQQDANNDINFGQGNGIGTLLHQLHFYK